MSVEQNKAIVRRYFDEIINRGRFETAEEIFAVDYTNHTAGGGIGTGRDGFIKGLEALRAAFPDWTVRRYFPATLESSYVKCVVRRTAICCETAV